MLAAARMGLQNLLTLHGDHVRSCWGRSSRRGDGGCQGCLLVFSGGKEGSKLPDLQAQDFRSEHAPAKGGRKNTCMLVHSNGETRAVRSYVEPLAFTGSNKGRVNRSEKERVGWYFLWLVTRDHAADQYPANPFAISTRLLSKQSSKSSRARTHTHLRTHVHVHASARVETETQSSCMRLGGVFSNRMHLPRMLLFIIFH